MRPLSWLVEHRRGIGIYLAIWVVLAVLAAVEVYVAQQVWDKAIPWSVAFGRASKEALAYAICTLGVLWLCGRLRSHTGHRIRWVSLHMLGALAFSLLHVTVVSGLETGERSVQTGQILTFDYLFKKLIVTYTVSNLFKYWIIVLGHLGWHYYKAYRERERQASALATELVRARFQALRMQINPHFLFNTLNTISAFVHQKPDAADRMIVCLSKLLRRTLDRGDMPEVPLHEEIECLQCYLEIEQMRFADRLTVSFEIDPKARDLFVPQLVLQPLVENALRHGLMPREEAGRVVISARILEGQRLELTVRDNGIGLTVASDGRHREGIGLKNVRSRLAQLYGPAQEFVIANTPQGGVEARVRIPCCATPRAPAPSEADPQTGTPADAAPPLPAPASPQ
ncbi:MAG TPA: histidine kinase [Verrucomicrobiota bacterium]|nr:histidine kinase [Verrucomicrobiota bacterium]HNU52399.1 histidine kinase [Verrucomicrobiota bacterium]